MWRFVVRFFAVVGLLAVVVVVGGGIAAYSLFLRDTTPPPPDQIILGLDLRDAPVDARPNGGGIQSLLSEQPVTLYELESALQRAADDPRVVGVSARFGDDVFGLSMGSEIEAAIERFKQSDKPTVAFANSFGMPGEANASYMVASAFDRIILRPVGSLGLTGLAAQPIFAGEALEDLGVSAQFARTGPYKTFPEMLTGSTLTDEHREMLDSILETSFAVLTNTIAENRSMAPRDVAALIDAGPLSAADALSAGLVDTLGGDRALADRKEAWFGTDAVEMGPRDYLSLPAPESVADDESSDAPDDRLRVALVHGDGMILERDAEEAPGGVLGILSAASLVETIDDIRAEGRHDGIILRLNTGGGSAIGSEMIANSISRARDDGMAVVVSMGQSAASGGYWVAVHADRIVATPTTRTGSIGVFAGKLSLGALGERLGIAVETVQQGDNADFWSFATPFSAEQEDRLQAMVDDLHGAFLDRVEAGREMSRPRVADLAEGRVWTGLQAVDLGLVDSLGGVGQAQVEIRDVLSVDADTPIRIDLLPEELGFLEGLMESLGEGVPFLPGASSGAWSGVDTLPPMLRAYTPLLPMLHSPDGMVLHMPFVPDF